MNKKRITVQMTNTGILNLMAIQHSESEKILRTIPKGEIVERGLKLLKEQVSTERKNERQWT